MHTNVFDLIGSQAKKKKKNEQNKQNTQKKKPYVMIFEMKICKV